MSKKNPKEKCKVKECKKYLIHLGYCSAHYQQFKKYGFIKRRTNRDKNEYIFEENICYIKLYDSLGNEKEEKVIIDRNDYDLVKDYKWGLFIGNYVWCSKKKLFLHNLLLISKNVDHKNGNGLDNRRINLRLANQSFNNMNKKIAINNTSGFKGVHFDKSSGKWKIQIRKNRKFVFKKLVTSKEEAACLYDLKAKEIFGEFARTNRMEGRI